MLDLRRRLRHEQLADAHPPASKPEKGFVVLWRDHRDGPDVPMAEEEPSRVRLLLDPLVEDAALADVIEGDDAGKDSYGPGNAATL